MSSQILLLFECSFRCYATKVRRKERRPTLGSKDRKQRKETDLKSVPTDSFLRSFPLLGEKEH